MARTLDIYNLLNQPDSNRDAEWERAFFEAFTNINVKIEAEEPVQGPDGWPYLMVSLSSEGKEPVQRVIEWLSKRGIGLVLNAHKGTPDYIFTYGMLWNYRERGEFLTEAKPRQSGEIAIKEGQQVMAGPPSSEFMPSYVRKIVYQFLSEQGVEDPRVLMVSFDMKNYDLCFSYESLGEPDASEHEGIVQAISWFFPQHYSIAITSERSLPKFFPLKSL